MPQQCSQCQTTNRDIAKFCKQCGVKLTLDPDPEKELAHLIGLDELKQEVQKLMHIAEINRDALRRRNLHTIIYGNTGTGKSHVANIIYRLFHKHGLTDNDQVVVADVTSAHEFDQKLESHFKKARGGILFIDNAHRLIQGGHNRASMDKLLSHMDAAGTDPIIVLSGLKRGIQDYIYDTPEVKSRFGYIFDLPDLNGEQLYYIARNHLIEAQLILTPESDQRLKRLFKYLAKTRDESFSNARVALAEADDIVNAYYLRVRQSGQNDHTILPEDIQQDIPEDKSTEDILKELDAFIGMEKVKEAIRSITQQIQFELLRTAQGLGGAAKLSRHFIITGNPGTGKTTVARKLGELFEAIDMLDRGHVVEVGGNDMLGMYLGETPKKVNALCDQALGGVLFIDEAYTLAGSTNGSNQFGQEAVDTLLKRMEDDRGKFVVIAAGYKDEMQKFIEMNPGLPSRFDLHLHIDDYNPEELLAIFRLMASKEHFSCSESADNKLARVMEDMYARRGPGFANGRSVRQIFDKAKSTLSDRLSQLPTQELNKEAFTTFEEEDIVYDLPEIMTLDKVMGELKSLVGMENIKEWIADLARLLAIQKKRAEITGQKFEVAPHLVLTGNPGTGKTTVARILGKTLKALEILPRGHIVEVDRKELVAPYVGQTAPKTNDAIKRAIGGVLFIDEAYTLASDDFGKEAINTLLKQMEDQRGAFVAIVAGYPREMQDFLDTNPGLASRFNQRFHLEDYQPHELTAIFKLMAKGHKYQLDEELDEPLQQLFEGIYDARGKDFGNARTVRGILEEAIIRQNKRLSQLENPEEEAYSLLTFEDIPGLEKEEAADLDSLFNELDQLIGLEAVKQEVKELAQFLKFQKMRRDAGDKTSAITPHFIFQGNPGTGKTTVARLLAKMFKQMGLLSKGHLVEVAREDLVASYIGQTAPKTSGVIDKAMGGVLFIDEAYTLSPAGSGQDFGIEAINTLLKRMEDDRGKFIVIAAGYHKEMADFLKANTGLQSRFTRFIDFEDYVPEEMTAIFRLMASKESMMLTPEADTHLENVFKSIYDTRDASFANGRTVRNVFDSARQKLAVRVSSTEVTPTPELLNTIQIDDLPVKTQAEEDHLPSLLAELNSLTGLEAVKNEINSLINYLQVQQMDREAGIKTGDLNLHFVFLGNPGTGKTTVARLLARLFKAMGILSKGHLAEVSEKDLTASYVGQTAPKTDAAINSAMGGVLFIDEAYSLARSTFGIEAIDTLLVRMENDRGKFIVIAAGYEKEMESFIGANSGLQSRFTRYIHFDDYRPDEMAAIFESMANKEGLTLTETARTKLDDLLTIIYTERDNNFANGRTVRNLYEKVKQNRATRLIESRSDSSFALSNELLASDITSK